MFSIAFDLHMTLEMNNEFYDVHVTSKRPMTDGQWHTLTVERSLIDLRVAVDFSEGFLNLPKGVTLKTFTGPFLLGGMKEYVYVLRCIVWKDVFQMLLNDVKTVVGY